MANMQPTKAQAAKTRAAPAKKAEDANLTPQELEAKKASESAKLEEERQANIKKLIKSKKYFLPIK